jgi:ubiquitin carboxyl-terminal hydrolase 5/13
MDDPDIDTPIATSGGAPSNEPSADQIALIVDMGFSPNQARKALKQAVSCW